MILKKYEDLPENLKNTEVKKYYDILSKKRISLFFKRFFDILFSFILLVLIFPFIIILGIIIKCDSKGPIFYKQERITMYGRKFKIYKFRTMVQNADKIGNLVTSKDDNRITKVGSKIRKLRIDELPQLINILKGDMSFVGTRPEVEKYVNAYSNEMKATLLMRAGVTSTASISYKDEDEIIAKYQKLGENTDDIYIKRVLSEKMKYNLEYIEKFNILNDIKICFKTVTKVL